jgi:hypothetical protein
MNNQYLTKKRKEYYLDDFNKLIKTDNPTWKIDSEELKEILININSNEFIQTLYSKQLGSKEEIDDDESYLEFTFAKKIELKIFRKVISYFIEFYNQDSTNFQSISFYDYSLPKDNPNYFKDSNKIGLKCTDDNNYFKINHLRITLKSSYPKIHKDFWSDLNNKLIDLKT